jgi:hypothetical protein
LCFVSVTPAQAIFATITRKTAVMVSKSSVCIIVFLMLPPSSCTSCQGNSIEHAMGRHGISPQAGRPPGIAFPAPGRDGNFLFYAVFSYCYRNTGCRGKNGLSTLSPENGSCSCPLQIHQGLAGDRFEGEITHPLRDFTQGVDCGLRALLMTYRKDEVATLPVEARNDQEGL